MRSKSSPLPTKLSYPHPVSSPAPSTKAYHHSCCHLRQRHHPHLISTAHNIHPCGDCNGSGGGRSTKAPPALSIRTPHPMVHCRDSIQLKPCVSSGD
eukprot:scaffold110771_cov71-Attheya_sp.AAC.1